jgi:hypothetical protein
MFDIEPGRLDQMASAGIERVKVSSSNEKECSACSGIAGKVYAITAAPVLPPAGCACVPWCRLVIAATSETDDNGS